MGMVWNGAAIGMDLIREAAKRTLRALHRGRIGFCVGAVGSATAGIAVLRTAAAAYLLTAATSLAFGWSSRISIGNPTNP